MNLEPSAPAGAPHVAITGATGYIGSHLVELASRQGFRVTALSRRAPESALAHLVNHRFYQLEKPVPADTLQNVDVLIHLAADTTSRTGSARDTPDYEVEAARHLFQVAVGYGVGRVIFLSSQSAATDAVSRYGRVKWEIERIALAAGATVIRPGLVYGGREAGLFGRLCAQVRHMPLLPRLIPSPRVQPVHVDDLCRGILALACRSQTTAGVFGIADSVEISFTDYLRLLSELHVRRDRLFVAVPAVLLRGVVRINRFIPFLPAGLDERLEGLFRLKPMDPSAGLRETGLHLRPLVDGLDPSGIARRRHLLREARALMKYVSGSDSDTYSLRRYVRFIERFDDGMYLHMSRAFMLLPRLLRLLDPRRPILCISETTRHRLVKRMELAMVLAEASPVGARMFRQSHISNLPLSVAFLCCVVSMEFIVSAFSATLCGLGRVLISVRRGGRYSS